MAGRILSVNVDNPEEETIFLVSSVIAKGGVIIYPSDTVYGLLTSATSEESCLKVASIKGYSAVRPFIVLAHTVAQACSMSSDQAKLNSMNNYWPGPVTLVLPASETVPNWLTAKSGTVALRVPADPLSQAILENISVNLVSTSANFRGEPAPVSLESVPLAMRCAADLVLDGGTLTGRKPSTVLDLTGDEPVALR